jgi:hypothetical protein
MYFALNQSFFLFLILHNTFLNYQINPRNLVLILKKKKFNIDGKLRFKLRLMEKKRKKNIVFFIFFYFYLISNLSITSFNFSKIYFT